ncbi:MAG: DUF6658 family protein [Halothece sp.]
MKNLIKKLQLRQILTVFFAGLLLFVTTACNQGDVRGARPNNLPVQAGGQNNPHKMGGDSYTKYKASPDSKLKDQAYSLPNNWLIARSNPSSPDEKASGRLYKTDTEVDERELPVIERGKTEAKEIPSQPQTIPQRSNPREEILENTGKAFQESTEFIREGTKKAFSGSQE